MGRIDVWVRTDYTPCPKPTESSLYYCVSAQRNQYVRSVFSFITLAKPTAGIFILGTHYGSEKHYTLGGVTDIYIIGDNVASRMPRSAGVVRVFLYLSTHFQVVAETIRLLRWRQVPNHG